MVDWWSRQALIEHDRTRDSNWMDCCWLPCLTAFLVGCFATTKGSTFSDSWSSKITWMVYQWQFVGQWWSMVYHGRLGNPPFLVVETSGVSLARFDGNPQPGKALILSRVENFEDRCDPQRACFLWGNRGLAIRLGISDLFLDHLSKWVQLQYNIVQ